jgi:hypothetical protein
MEQLSVLEKKLMMLIESKKRDAQRLCELSQELERQREENLKLREQMDCLQQAAQSEIAKIMEEGNLLRSQIEKLENTLLVRHQNSEQERELTKMAVDDLIKSIDIVVEHEQQQ